MPSSEIIQLATFIPNAPKFDELLGGFTDAQEKVFIAEASNAREIRCDIPPGGTSIVQTGIEGFDLQFGIDPVNIYIAFLLHPAPGHIINDVRMLGRKQDQSLPMWSADLISDNSPITNLLTIPKKLPTSILSGTMHPVVTTSPDIILRINDQGTARGLWLKTNFQGMSSPDAVWHTQGKLREGLIKREAS